MRGAFFLSQPDGPTQLANKHLEVKYLTKKESRILESPRVSTGAQDNKTDKDHKDPLCQR